MTFDRSMNGVHAFQVEGAEKSEEILGRGFIEDKLCELGLGEVTIIWGNPKIQIIIDISGN